MNEEAVVKKTGQDLSREMCLKRVQEKRLAFTRSYSLGVFFINNAYKQSALRFYYFIIEKETMTANND